MLKEACRAFPKRCRETERGFPEILTLYDAQSEQVTVLQSEEVTHLGEELLAQRLHLYTRHTRFRHAVLYGSDDANVSDVMHSSQRPGRKGLSDSLWECRVGTQRGPILAILTVPCQPCRNTQAKTSCVPAAAQYMQGLV